MGLRLFVEERACASPVCHSSTTLLFTFHVSVVSVSDLNRDVSVNGRLSEALGAVWDGICLHVYTCLKGISILFMFNHCKILLSNHFFFYIALLLIV